MTVIKYHKLGKLQSQEFILSQPGGRKFEINMWAELCPPESQGEGPSCHFQFLGAACNPGPFPWPSYRDASFGFKAHPDSASPHLNYVCKDLISN